MNEPLIVEVTEEDIRRGLPGEDLACPIAMACLRLFPGAHPSMDLDDLTIYFTDHVQRYDAEPRARRFVRNFDKGKRVRPATFTFVPVSR